MKPVLVAVLGASVAQHAHRHEFRRIGEIGNPLELPEEAELAQERRHLVDLRRELLDLDLELIAPLGPGSFPRRPLYGEARPAALRLPDAQRTPAPPQPECGTVVIRIRDTERPRAVQFEIAQTRGHY